jgi:hypothetical protein
MDESKLEIKLKACLNKTTIFIQTSVILLHKTSPLNFKNIVNVDYCLEVAS